MVSHRDIGILVDSESVLSTRYGKTRGFINKNLINRDRFSTRPSSVNRDLLSTSLIVGKIGIGMWCVKYF